jgi:hypothetical protein
MDNQQSRGRWGRYGAVLFRFRLRTLFVLVALAAISLGLHARHSAQADRQQELRKEIRQHGFSVHRSDSSPSNAMLPATSAPWFPDWLVSIVGKDYLSSLGAVSLVEHPNAADLLRRLDNEQAGIRFLQIVHCDVSDVDVDSFDGLTQLQHLVLIRVPITDRAISRLAPLRSLECLSLHGTLVTDRAIEHIAALPRLRSIDVTNTKVTAQGVSRLRQLKPECEILCDYQQNQK